MRRNVGLALLSATMSCFLGCDRSTANTADLKSVSAAKAPGAVDTIPPKFIPIEVFTNNKRFSDENGCTYRQAPKTATSQLKMKHESTCGHPGAVSKVSWQYLRTSDEGDHYRFERRFPLDAQKVKISEKDIVYAGVEIVLFEDDVQRITIRPPLAN